MKRSAILLLFALPAFAAEPSKFTLAQSGASADPLTVLGPAAVCADQQIALWNGASNTSLQCSVVTIADATGAIAGAASITVPKVILDPAVADTYLGKLGTLPAQRISMFMGGSEIWSTSVSVGDMGWSGIALNASRSLTWGTLGGDLDLFLFRDAANTLSQRNAANAQTFRLYGTADAHPTLTNFARLSLAATDGTSTITTETAGTAADDQNLVVKGEGPTATLTLDGSDDVAGSVTVSANGMVTASNGFIATAGGITTSGGNQYLWYAAGSPNTLLIAQGNTHVALQIRANIAPTANLQTWTSSGNEVLAAIGPSGQLIGKRQVTPDIDGETTTAANSGTVWTNTGDGDGEAITLLNDPGIGVQYCFAVDVAQTITVAPSTGETLYYGTDNCVASLTSNAIGSTLCVTAITGGSGAKWFTMSHEGSWTCND